MKKIFIVCSLSFLFAASSFSQTNSVPSGKSPSTTIPKATAKQPLTQSVAAAAPAPAARNITHNAELTPRQTGLFNKIQEEGLLTRGRPKNYNGVLRATFMPRDPWGGPAMVYSPVDVIMPTGQ